MPTEKKPRELTTGAAIAKLQALGTRADYVVHAVTEAAEKARVSATAEYQKKLAAIVGRVHPSAQLAVLKEAGHGDVPACFEPIGEDVPPMTSEEIDEALAENDAAAENGGEIPARLREPLDEKRLAVGKGR